MERQLHIGSYCTGEMLRIAQDHFHAFPIGATELYTDKIFSISLTDMHINTFYLTLFESI